ncbi:hypothetical protein Patl1_06359 [Pistacia atlantica]|uniref:Uncharacterized protein n=1 Tax=Pistacia atlantica TaxID=434234 RepID=A0ACC1BWS7_9ROSI|nr:hypothetical protein Patl1_06359 [Pistacia atlantica]
MAGKEEGPAIGIDLGTTYSCVGLWGNDRVEITANDQGNRTTPSYVAFAEMERFLGDAAKNQVAMNPMNTIFAYSSLQDPYGEGFYDLPSLNCVLNLLASPTSCFFHWLMSLE